MFKAPSPSWQELGDEFMTMIGNCITEWANVEEALFNICWRSLGSHKEQAAIVYYRTPTIDARMSLVDELVRSVLPKKDRPSGGHDHPDVKWWTQIEKRFREMQHTRRRIAHHPVIIRQNFEEVDDVGQLKRESWFEVYISQSEAARGKSIHLEPLTIDDLHRHLQGVNRITSDLSQFLRNALLRHTETLSQTDPYASNQP